MEETILRAALVPNEQTLLDWISTIHAQGIRRPGYPADRWAERFCAERMRTLGLEQVRLEPAELPYWEPRSASLHVDAGAERFEVPCFGLPFSVPTAGLHAELASFDTDARDAVRGKAGGGS